MFRHRRSAGDESAAEAARTAEEIEHPEPLVLNLGRQDRIEVEIVCQRLKSEGIPIMWTFARLHAHGTSNLGWVQATVAVPPDQAEYVVGELRDAGLL